MQAVAVKRTSMEIIHEILQLNGKKKTDIMYKTALTYPQTLKYLEMLKSKGLIKAKQDARGRDVFEPTDKGRELLRHLSVIVDALGVSDSGA